MTSLPTRAALLDLIDRSTQVMAGAKETIRALTIENNHLKAQLKTETQALTQMGYLYRQLLAGEKRLRTRLELADRVISELLTN